MKKTIVSMAVALLVSGLTAFGAGASVFTEMDTPFSKCSAFNRIANKVSALQAQVAEANENEEPIPGHNTETTFILSAYSVDATVPMYAYHNVMTNFIRTYGTECAAKFFPESNNWNLNYEDVLEEEVTVDREMLYRLFPSTSADLEDEIMNVMDQVGLLIDIESDYVKVYNVNNVEDCWDSTFYHHSIVLMDVETREILHIGFYIYRTAE